MKKLFKNLMPMLLLVAGLGISPNAWAAVSVKSTSYVYFNPSASSWDSYSYIYLTIGEAWGWQMKSVSNTKLRVCSTDEYNNSGIRLFAPTSDWGDKNTNMGGWDNMKNNASNITDWYGSDWTFNNGDYTILNLNKKGSTSDLAQITPTYLGNSKDAMNKTQTIKAKVSTNGGSTYSEANTPGKLTGSSNKFSNYNTCGTSTSCTLNAGSSSTTIVTGYTATTTLTAADATGYTFVAWYKGSSQVSTDKSITIYPTDEDTYYAYYKANGYQVKFDGNGATSGSMSNEQYYYGVSKALTANAFQRTNYNFVGWNTDKNATTVLYTDGKLVSNLSSTDGDVVTLYAIWALAQVDVTYGVFGSANGTIQLGSETPITGNATQKVDGASTVVFTATPSANYTVEGWYANSSCTGDKLLDGDNTGAAKTYTIPNITEAKTVYVKFRERDYSITLSKGTGINAIKVDGTAQDNVTAHVATKTGTITAEVADGYTWKEWEITSGNITADNALTTNGIQINATSTGTLTATATEILHSVTMASSDDNKGTVDITSDNKTAGIATAINIKATPKAGYYFTGWTASDGSKVTFGSSSSATTTAKVTADGITITANFANRYAFRGSLNETNNPHGGMPGWGNDALITFTGETGSVQYTLQPNKQYKFLIYDLKNNTNRGFTSTDQTFSWNGEATFNGTYHALLNTRGTGTYTFTIAINGDYPRVTLVGQVSHTITFGKGTGGNSISASSNNDGTINSNQYVKTGSTVTFTQTPLTGYEFKGWYTSSTGSTAVDGITTEGVMANVTADKQVYAQYKPITYNITYPASPEHYTINAEAPKTADYNTTATFTVTPDKGYLVDVTATQTGTSTEVTLQRSGNTYTIQSMPAYNVTINVTAHKFKLNGWGSSSSDKEFDANWEYKENLNALTTYEFKLHNTAPGLKNNGYFGNNGTIESTITSGWTMSDNEGTKLKLKTGIAGTYTFTYCEVEENGVMKPQIKVTFPQVSKLVYNDTDYPFTDLGNGTWKAGPLSLAANTTLSNNIQMYWEGTCIKNDNDATMTASSHTDWGMVRYTEGTSYIKITTAGDNSKTFAKNPDNYYFYYKPNASPKPALTVEYPSYWRGDAGTTLGWNYDHPMEFVNDVATIELDVQTDGDREMKVIVDGQYWTYEGTKISTSTNDIQFVKDDQANKSSFKFNVAESMKGIYTFTFNRSNHQMSVNYPDVVQYDITYTDAEGTKTIKAGPNGGRGISAANKPGYKFVRWELYPDDINKIAVADNNKTRQTTTVYGKAEGCSITAIYTNEHFIYFKNIPGWSDVYVQFYSNPYFHGDDGTGDKNKGTGTGGDKNTSLVNGTIYHMTHIDKTDIWYFDYSAFASNATAQHTVAFTDSKQDNHSFFDQCQVVYRGDFGECAPMMVPINYIDQYLNQHDNQRTCYYGQGHWMKYDAAENTAMGIKLHIYEYKNSNWTDISGSPFDFLADNDGSYSSYVSGITLPSGNYVYHIKLEGCATGGTWYGNTGKMTTSECSNWVMSINAQDMEFQSTSDGPYTFRLTTGDGQLKLSAEYPLTDGDFRVIHTTSDKTYYTDITYKGAVTKADTASFFFNTNETSPVFKVQICKDAVKGEWDDVSGAIFTNPTATGVYNFIFSHERETVTIQKTEPYTGNYYVRCEALNGGLENYEANADNRMNYTTANPAFAADNQQGYNYYKTRWITIGKDVSYTVANDYSKNISATMTEDNIIGTGKQTLPADANVRFTWNSNTNALSRAYIKGSSNTSDKFVQVYGTNIYSDSECLTALTPEAPGLFKDNQDWVYEYTMYAKTGATATVMTSYNDHQQYLISNQAVFSSTKDADIATLRTLYDFKTNRFVAAWTPSGQIDAEYSISADIMLMRNGQQQADQLTFGDGGSITGEPKTVYGAVKFDQSLMALEAGHGYQTYDRSIFWISFPFDVRLNDVFGLGQYGKYWIIRYYDGAERASKGWFLETKTFWKTVSVAEREHGGTDGKGFVLKANEGYNLVLDYTAVLKDLYPNGATENYLFFPSKDKLKDIPASLQTESITYEPLTCTITSPEDRRNEDSNWRVIGVPSYANAGELTSTEGIKFYYAWNRDNNTLGVDKIKETNPRGGEVSGTFQSMHAYMVQFAGTIDWKNLSIEESTTPATAPLFANNEKEEYSLRLELQQEGKKVDQAYVDLTDEATENFDLNLDITKLMYSTSQIYSFIGNDKVAANSLPVQDVVVPLCITAAANGTYTIALPDGTEGLNVTLYDALEGQETNLSFGGYTVDLNKGEYNNRFMLNISIPKVPTDIGNTETWSEDGKTKKLLINDQIYLINGGRVYNANGVQLR